MEALTQPKPPSGQVQGPGEELKNGDDLSYDNYVEIFDLPSDRHDGPHLKQKGDGLQIAKLLSCHSK